MTGQDVHKNKSDLSSLVLKQFFEKNPDIVEKYCKKYRTDISD